uniref:MARVEL domain-containing protein n=1 Tax=Plectus sambesii TaxID=2011161 RepID=A0A914V7B7_9BILA
MIPEHRRRELNLIYLKSFSAWLKIAECVLAVALSITLANDRDHGGKILFAPAYAALIMGVGCLLFKIAFKPQNCQEPTTAVLFVEFGIAAGNAIIFIISGIILTCVSYTDAVNIVLSIVLGIVFCFDAAGVILQWFNCEIAMKVKDRNLLPIYEESAEKTKLLDSPTIEGTD